MRTRKKAGMISLATVCLTFLVAGYGAPALAGGPVLGPATGRQTPPGPLFLVPAGISEVGVQNSTSIHDYGPQRLVVIPNPDSLSVGTRSRVTELSDPTSLSYRGWSGPVQPLTPRAVTGLPSAYYLVALTGPIEKKWEAVLVGLGITVVDVAAPYALVVHCDGGQLLRTTTASTSLGYSVVRGFVPVPNETRLDPDLLRVVSGLGTIAEIPGLRKSADGQGVVRVFPYADVPAASLMADLRTHAASPSPALAYGYEDAILIRGPELKGILANIPGVAYIEALHERVLHNNIAALGTVLNVEPVWTSGYDGTGIIVDHNDSGCDASHPDFPAGTFVARAGPLTGIDNGHGTHTAGSVLGRGLAAGSPAHAACPETNLPTVRGMAPGARLVDNNIFYAGGTPPGFTTETSMMEWASQNGSHLSTNSWGYGSVYTYNANARSIDIAIRDAQPSLGGNQELSILFSAGNDGPGASTIGTPGSAKNALTVGASQSTRCGSYVPAYCAGPNINTMACFSGRGPSQGRIKPDLVAVGTDVISTQSQDGAATHPWDEAWTGAWYEIDSGTSMSCPITAGATAVFFEFYNATNPGFFPSPALSKAAMVNGAVNMGLGYPSNSQGWGRIELMRSIQGPPGGSIVFVDQREITPLVTAATWTKTFSVSSAAIPLEVTLAWTDPPGAAGCGSCLINNLNLVVTSPDSTIYRGNQLTTSWSTANPAGTDTANNLENVFVQTPLVGMWTIQVTSANTAVNPPGMTGQDFAVVYSGGIGPACTTPGVPAIGTATASAANQITVSWANGSPAAATFKVYRAIGTCAAPGPFSAIASGLAGSPYVDNTVSGGTTYAYRVSGVDSTGGCESAKSGCVEATATGLCTLAPTFAGLTSVVNNGTASCGLTVGWAPGTSNCGGTVTYNVYRSTGVGCPVVPAAGNRVAAGVAGTSYVDTTGLTSGTTYCYVVRAVDSANSSEDTNSVQGSGTPTGPITVGTVTETFEAAGGFDNAGWTHNFLSGSVDWVWSTARSQTPTHSWFSADQASTSDRVLVSPSFLAQATSTLSFWHTYAFEGNVAQCYDAGTLEVTTNGGTSWTVFPGGSFTAGGFNGTVNAGFGNPIAGKAAWCAGTIGALTRVTANLSAYNGQTVQLRWHEGDDSSAAGTGWYVDSVTLTNVGTQGTCSSCTVPAAPAAPTFTAVTCTSQTVNWGAVAGATTYDVWRATGASCTGAVKITAVPVAGTSYNDTPLTGGTQYSYYVTANNACGASANGACASSTTAPATPAAPTGVAAANNCNNVTVSWTASAGATAYDVLRGTICGTTVTTFPGVTSPYADTTAVAGTSYQYWVVARNACGTSVNSSCVAGTRSLPTPAAPTGVSATTASCDNVTVTWNASAGATQYNVVRGAICGTAAATFTNVSSPYSDATAVPGTSYQYWVVASNVCGSSGNSLCAAGLALTSPAAPNPVTATATAPNEITVAWTAVGGATTYTVYRSSGLCPGGVFSVLQSGIAGTSLVDSTVTGGLAYSYKVVAVNSCGSSAQSACAGTTAVGICTAAPTFGGLTSATAASGGTCGVDLAWSAGASSCGNSVNYSVYRSTVSGFSPGSANRISGGVTGLTYSDSSGLAASTTYYYVVRAADTGTGTEDSNTTEQSAAVPATCSSGAPDVEAFTATSTGDAGATTGQNLLQWLNPASGPGGLTITVNFRTDTFPTSATDALATAIPACAKTVTLGAVDSCTHQVLTNGTTYYYALWVRN